MRVRAGRSASSRVARSAVAGSPNRGRPGSLRSAMAPSPPCRPPRSSSRLLLLLLLLLSVALLGVQARAEPAAAAAAAAGSAVPAQSRPCVDCHAFEFMQRALQDLRKTAYSLDARVSLAREWRDAHLKCPPILFPASVREGPPPPQGLTRPFPGDHHPDPEKDSQPVQRPPGGGCGPVGRGDTEAEREESEGGRGIGQPAHSCLRGSPPRGSSGEGWVLEVLGA
uniref:NELL2-interacting cell ontogeny regulator 1 n=2 Tax=Sus scrofa TaxID=9823 RepID=A0A8D2AG68_PIG